ncbi:uncharacterized protein EDB91DRAFT_1083647 [Suillus paluster]|uniref:uncharacterized protein n=1 Tax=Suillus paluster TaxID=48578 RepID=UPI001B875C47|nr:uncharacterized protein EDB91DRAFT_1083647 [Suillus paluster]KAG1735747.1 hypothetical protein EDB91DRAFT_1083647 [Suillus paluster]
MDDNMELISNPQTVIAEEDRWAEYDDQAWVAAANNIVAALVRTNGLLEQGIAAAEESWAAMDRFVEEQRTFQVLFLEGMWNGFHAEAAKEEVEGDRGAGVFGDMEVQRKNEKRMLPVDPRHVEQSPQREAEKLCCKKLFQSLSILIMSAPQNFFARMSSEELQVLLAAVRKVEEEKAAAVAERARRAEEARVAAEAERVRMAEEARRVVENRCKWCKATSWTCTWGLVRDALAKTKGKARAKAKACNQCVGLKASCRVGGGELQPAAPVKSWKRTREKATEAREGVNEDAGGPSWRRKVYGEEEAIAEVKDQEWVKAANNMVLAQAETNAQLGALAMAITHLVEQMELQQVEQKEERDEAQTEGKVLKEVLGKKAEIGVDLAEVPEAGNSSSSSDMEKLEGETESKAEKGPSEAELESQLEPEDSAEMERYRRRDKLKTGFASRCRVRNSIPELLAGQSNWLIGYWSAEFWSRDGVVGTEVAKNALASAWPGFFFGIVTYLFLRKPYKFLLMKILSWCFLPSKDGNNIEMLNMERRVPSDEFDMFLIFHEVPSSNFVMENMEILGQSGVDGEARWSSFLREDSPEGSRAEEERKQRWRRAGMGIRGGVVGAEEYRFSGEMG